MTTKKPTEYTVTHCPERVAYRKFLNEDNSEMKDKDYKSLLKAYVTQYVLSFHNYFAEFYPHLRFEKGEAKMFWNYNEETGVYDEVTVTTVQEMVLKLIIDEGLIGSATDSVARNVIAKYRACYSERGSSYDDFDTNGDLFHCKNGWVNVNTLEFSAHTPDRLSRRVSAVVYDKDATCPMYDELLDTKIAIPKDQVRVLDQYSGLLLTPRINQQKMLALIGKAGSGKSTIMELWSSILGGCATKQSLSELSGESSRFMGESLVGRTMCWFDEVEPDRSKMGDKLIGMVTAKTFRVERKGINGITNAQNKLKFILTANSLPRSAEIGIYRRLILIYLNHSFYDAGNPDTNIQQKLEAEMSGVLNRMLRGLADLNKLGTFAVIDGHSDLIEDYKTSSNVVAEFLEEHFVFDENATPIKSSVLLEAYKDFVGNNKYTQSLTPQRFGTMMAQHGLSKFNNVQTKKGTGGMRQWTGLKLNENYTFNERGVIRAVYQESSGVSHSVHDTF